MDERTELIETLSLIVRPENAAKMVDAFAHELAEKIRSQQCPEEILAVELGWAAVWRRGVNDSANEIDPYLSRVDSTSVVDTGRDQP